MALFQKGLNLEETRLLLDGMLHSGETLDMEGIPSPRADKHSTGGVGDKVSLVLAPLAAACGLSVPMLSGRGLGHTGGTLDKLESIPGFNVFLSTEAIRQQVAQVGCVIAGQTDAIVPADKILYAMRDETATVEHPSLIAASILSKKLAEGIDVLLLDVKFGRGAFLEQLEDAEYLARLMVDLGRAAGCRVGAWLTRMDTPLGRAVGNAVEVAECIDILKGKGPEDLTGLIVHQVAGMVELSGLREDFDGALALAEERLADGSALEKFRRMIEAQGGDPGVIEDPDRLPQARFVAEIFYEESNPAWVADVDARAVAEVVLETGAGRRTAADAVDHSAGISSLVCPGDRLEPGDVVARLHHSDSAREPAWVDGIRKAITFSGDQPVVENRIHKRITHEQDHES
jgi:pyrimidine-nucleoside phosphorylase